MCNALKQTNFLLPFIGNTQEWFPSKMESSNNFILVTSYGNYQKHALTAVSTTNHLNILCVFYKKQYGGHGLCDNKHYYNCCTMKGIENTFYIMHV